MIDYQTRDYIAIVHKYMNTYYWDEPVPDRQLELQDFEYAFEWRYTDLCFPIENGKPKTLQDDMIFKSYYRHYMSLTKSEQTNLMKDFCNIVGSIYEDENDNE